MSRMYNDDGSSREMTGWDHVCSFFVLVGTIVFIGGVALAMFMNFVVVPLGILWTLFIR